MNKLSTSERCQIVRALVEGNSVNSTCRMTGFNKRTVLKLLCDMGRACRKLHNDRVKGLTCQRVQVDEIWNFCHAKQKNLPEHLQGQTGFGDVWTFVGIDADTKLIVAWHIGKRTAEYACDFMLDMADRIITRIQLTTDGLNKYPKAVADAFGDNVDFAQLIKIYSQQRGAGEARYSPPALTAYVKHQIIGDADLEHVSTSFVERQNLTMRMSMRRFTRLTNGFSKKFENLKHAVSLSFAYYNWCRIHQTIRVTPAMEAGLTDHVWEIEELVALLD